MSGILSGFWKGLLEAEYFQIRTLVDAESELQAYKQALRASSFLHSSFSPQLSIVSRFRFRLSVLVVSKGSPIL